MRIACVTIEGWGRSEVVRCKFLQRQTLRRGNWLHGNRLFVTLYRTLKRVRDSEMPIGEFDLLAGIMGR